MDTDNNLRFILKPISAVGIRPSGAAIKIAIGTIQRITALRAYSSYDSCKDWMEKLSNSYVVAIATRSADTLLMQHIQNNLNSYFKIQCSDCINASIGLSLIRERLFPELKALRKHANNLIHHLDDPTEKGISELNIEGVFNYCYSLFNENIDALFGAFPNLEGKFEYKKCKKCRKREV